MARPIYLVYPPESRRPGISRWICEITADMSADHDWGGWSLRPIPLRPDTSFKVSDLTSRVKPESGRGPVLFVVPAKSAPRKVAQDKLKDITVTDTTDPLSRAVLLRDLANLRDRFLSFVANSSLSVELPRRLVACILIVRKLHNQKKWGGNHDKNFLAGEDIPNGGGVDTVKDIARIVVNELSVRGILITKYGGRSGRQKYALNKKRRHDIELLKDGVCVKSIRDWAYKHHKDNKPMAVPWVNSAGTEPLSPTTTR